MLRIFEWRHAACLLAASVALQASAAGSADFIDPLDRPALASAIAAQAPLMAVVRTPGGRMVACGRRGVVLFSDDGKAWQQARVPVSTDLVALAFPTAQHGWAVGHGGVVLHTSDGGQTWSRQLDGRQIPDLLVSHFKPRADAGDEKAAQALADAQRYREDGPGRPLLAVWFADERHGIAVGAYNLALRTEDGGRSWSVLGDQLDNPQGMHLYAITAAGSALWIAGEQGLLLKGPAASAPGATFSRVATPYSGSFFGVAAHGDTVLAFGLRGNAVRSTDAGQSWQSLDTGTQSTLTGGAVLPQGAIALVSASGELLVVPGGPADRPAKSRAAPAMPLHGLASLDATHVVLVGARGAVVQPLVQAVQTAPALKVMERSEK